MQGKPYPEGLKYLSVNPKGLVLDFKIYQDKHSFLDTVSNLGVDLSVIEITDTIL